MENLEKMFDDLLGEIRLVNTREQHDPYKLEAIRTCGAKVVVGWRTMKGQGGTWMVWCDRGGLRKR